MTHISRKICVFTKLLGTHITAKKLQVAQIGNYSTLTRKLIYTEFGDPIEVVRKVEEQLEPIKPDELLVKMLASPVNPADINTIQGRYPSAPTLPAVGGNEGVGIVEEVGSSVLNFVVGDRVIPLSNNSGTWGTHVTMKERSVFKVPTQLGLLEAATLKVNPCTAYRMLSDFVQLRAGDTVIQNGGNSACGQYVVQLCKHWKINTVSVVRNRPNIDELKNLLTDLGATHVLTEEELRKTLVFKNKELPRPRLALNCVGGKNALDVMRQLEPGGSMVTYGGMSRDPVTVPTSAFIFKDVKLSGFWMTRWGLKNIDSVEQSEMFRTLIKLMTNGKLQGPVCEMVEFDEYKEALQNTMNMKGMVGKKYVLRYA